MKQKIVLFVSIIAGLLAAVLTRGYLATKEAEFNKRVNAFNATHGVIDVLCFKKDVPSGTEITKELLGVKRVPKSGVEGRAIDADEHLLIEGKRIILARKRGDVVFWADIEGGNPRSGGLADDIKRQMRAISINASGAAAVSGMVRPNDHVDVIGTFTMPDDQGRPQQGNLVTCTILQNVLVLATGQNTAKSAARAALGSHQQAGYSMVTLEVTPREAEMLVFAEQMKGRLTLALRNRSDISYESELPKVDFEKIRAEIEDLNKKRQLMNGSSKGMSR